MMESELLCVSCELWKPYYRKGAGDRKADVRGNQYGDCWSLFPFDDQTSSDDSCDYLDDDHACQNS